ncbi:MAG: MurT ligase domain-containing protein [Clostridia bacterium]|nr:MurT ligase domain-containing protein [Clostridia bacterium]
MGKLKFLVAHWAAKASVVALKITKHNGTNFPGELAIKICPDFLKYIDKPETIIGVTGTNGKTTVCNLLIDMFTADGQVPLNNRAGSNINSGIATSLIHGANLFGKCKHNLGVLEIDERSALRVFPYVKPNYLIITNLFRDSMKRNANTEYIADILSKYIPKETKLVLNADDLISSNVAPENPRVYFGIDKMDSDIKECTNLINDIRICPVCHSKLEYEYLRYHHIGKAHCVSCDFKSPGYDYCAKNVNIDDMTMEIVDKDGLGNYRLISNGIHNIYNMVTVIALFRELGYKHGIIEKLMSQTSIVKSRYNAVPAGKVRVINQMAKENNALGSSRAFDFVSKEPNDKELILMMNCLGDEKHWSENTCWLYDCDFEFLNDEKIKKIIVTGPRYKDYILRLLIAGVDRAKIVDTAHEIDAPDLLDFTPGEDIYVFFGTDSLALGNKVLAKTIDLAKERGDK